MSVPDGPWRDSDDLSQDWGLGLPRFENDEDEPDFILDAADEFDEHFGVDDKEIRKSANDYDQQQ